MSFAPRIAMLAAAAVVGLAGCASDTSSPTALRAPESALLALGPTNSTPVLGQIKVCKTGNVSGTFAVSGVTFGSATTLGDYTAAPVVAAGTCEVVAEDQSQTSGSGSRFTVDETSAGFVDGTSVFISAATGVSPALPLTDGSIWELNAFHGYVLTYNNYVEPPVHPEVCDFITFGRLVTTLANGTKVVISGNAGGNKPGGGFLGHINVQVGDTKYNVKPIDDYGPIGSGVLSTYTNSRFASGVDKNSGATVEVRLWDGGEPGKNTDRVGLTINGVVILSGQTIDQGNMQYHANCRGPADATVSAN